MKNIPTHWYSLGHAILVLVYISGVALIMFNAESLFGNDRTLFVPIAMLMLFVLSAAVMGVLVLGRPTLMYLDGEKKEALLFLGYTIMWLFILTVAVFAILSTIR